MSTGLVSNSCTVMSMGCEGSVKELVIGKTSSSFFLLAAFDLRSLRFAVDECWSDEASDESNRSS